jgi:hypothetical protein
MDDARERLWVSVFSAVYALELPRTAQTKWPMQYASSEAMDSASREARSALAYLSRDFALCTCGHSWPRHDAPGSECTVLDCHCASFKRPSESPAARQYGPQAGGGMCTCGHAQGAHAARGLGSATWCTDCRCEHYNAATSGGSGGRGDATQPESTTGRGGGGSGGVGRL